MAFAIPAALLVRLGCRLGLFSLVGPEQAIARADGPADMLCAQAFARYQRALKAYNALDFDDLILLPVQIFQQFPEVLAKWQRRVHYMLVDEYQVTNISQYLLVQLLIGDRGKLTVVGDDDQSIYAWRGADIKNILEFEKDYPESKVVRLEQIQGLKDEEIPIRYRDHALFAAFAPAEAPEIALAVVVEHAGKGGGAIAAPIAQKVLAAYFRKHPPKNVSVCFRMSS